MSYQASGSQEPIRAVPRSQSVRALAVRVRASKAGSIDRILDATCGAGARQATPHAG
jgi:hypothetical protein